MNIKRIMFIIITLGTSALHADGYKAYFYAEGNWHNNEKLDIELQYTDCDSKSTEVLKGQKDIPVAVITGPTYWGLPCCLHKIIVKENGNQLYDHIVDRCSEVKFHVIFDQNHHIEVNW
jgi:hypothetical protein